MRDYWVQSILFFLLLTKWLLYPKRIHFCKSRQVIGHMKQVLNLRNLEFKALDGLLPPGIFFLPLEVLVYFREDGRSFENSPVASLAVDIHIELSLAHVAATLALLHSDYVTQSVNERQVLPLVREERNLRKRV